MIIYGCGRAGGRGVAPSSSEKPFITLWNKRQSTQLIYEHFYIHTKDERALVCECDGSHILQIVFAALSWQTAAWEFGNMRVWVVKREEWMCQKKKKEQKGSLFFVFQSNNGLFTMLLIWVCHFSTSWTIAAACRQVILDDNGSTEYSDTSVRETTITTTKGIFPRGEMCRLTRWYFLAFLGFFYFFLLQILRLKRGKVHRRSKSFRMAFAS